MYVLSEMRLGSFKSDGSIRFQIGFSELIVYGWNQKVLTGKIYALFNNKTKQFF